MQGKKIIFLQLIICAKQRGSQKHMHTPVKISGFGDVIISIMPNYFKSLSTNNVTYIRAEMVKNKNFYMIFW